jgi:hypothetical protein
MGAQSKLITTAEVRGRLDADELNDKHYKSNYQKIAKRNKTAGDRARVRLFLDVAYESCHELIRDRYNPEKTVVTLFLVDGKPLNAKETE